MTKAFIYKVKFRVASIFNQIYKIDFFNFGY